MLKYFILLMIIPFSINAQEFWQVENENMINTASHTRDITPRSYTVHSLDMDGLREYLRLAPAITNSAKLDNAIPLLLPHPDGTLKTFYIFEIRDMQPGLSQKYSHIRSYKGYSKDNRSENCRFVVSSYGFHGAVRSDNGQIYIDPLYTDDHEYYQTYYTRDHKVDVSSQRTQCGLEAEALESEPQPDYFANSRNYEDPVVKRTYRFALACTGEWGALTGSVDEVLAKMVVGVNRLNLIFENELAMNIVLVDNNDLAIHLDGSTDPYNNPQSGGSLIGQNTGILNTLIGEDNYDFGHIWSNCTDVGGIASLGSVCGSNKGSGATCLGPNNITGAVVNITAHEIGHQLDANHTFNNCNGNENFGTAFEPGSGTTIMSYAGLCGPNNVQGFNDDYYHVGSLNEMYNFTKLFNGNTCATHTPTENHCPEVSIPLEDGFYIPISTPFILEGEAFDPDGDDMTYSWEQYDTGPQSSLGEPLNNAPSFRVLYPGDSRVRLFPRLANILNNTSTSVEVLPTVNRELTFRFVVRDNHPEAGTASWAEVKFNATQNAGPFVVTYPNAVEDFEVGSEVEVTWDVANTDLSPVNCSHVNILMTTDGGLNFDHVLATNIPNDGAEIIVIPNKPTNLARVKIEAVNNIFFNISRPNFRIVEPSEPSFYLDISASTIEVCLPDVVTLDVRGTAFLGFDNPVSLDVVSGLPEGATAQFMTDTIAPDGSTSLSIDFTDVDYGGQFPIILSGIAEGADTVFRTLVVNATGTVFEDLQLVSPAAGTAGFSGAPEFTWTAAQNAERYIFEISTNPVFDTTSLFVNDMVMDTFISPDIILDESTVYYWRVRGANSCTDDGFSDIYALGTQALTCLEYEALDLPKNITQSGLPTIESKIEVFDQGIVSDVNITKIKGLHDYVSQIRASLVGPSGTAVKLFENRCGNQSDFNIGFDQESANELSCPLTGGRIVRPLESLDMLNGELLEGNWILRIEDTQAGDGGVFQEFSLEICSSVALDNPFIVNNDTLRVPPGGSNRIFSDHLLVDDNNNSDDELIYTVVATPVNGYIELNGEVLLVGDLFTQADLNNGLFRYKHTGTEISTDAFLFTVIDGEGGWIDITQFTVSIEEGIISSSEEIVSETPLFRAYPIPAIDHIVIERTGPQTDSWGLQMLDVNGRVLSSIRIDGLTHYRWNLTALPEGIYFIKVNEDKRTYVEMISIAR